MKNTQEGEDDDGHRLPEFRMYEREYPAIDSLAMAEITEITDHGATCRLIEYADKEATITFNDWSRKKIKSATHFVRVGTRHIVQILRVDEEKGYIDVGRRNVTPTESKEYEEYFKKTCAVHNMLQRLSVVTEIALPDIYESYAWFLYRDFPHAHDVLFEASKNPQLLDKYNDPLDALMTLQTLPSVEFVKIIQHRLHVPPVKVVCKIKVSCLDADGLDRVKEALRHGLQAANSELFPLDIVVEACPVYIISTKSDNKKGAKQAVLNCSNAIKEYMMHVTGGIFEGSDPYVNDIK